MCKVSLVYDELMKLAMAIGKRVVKVRWSSQIEYSSGRDTFWTSFLVCGIANAKSWR